MTTTIEAMKQAHAILQSGDLLCEVTAASILREAIAAEEAQGVEAKGFRVYPLDFARWMRDNRNCFLNVDVDHAADVIERLVKDQGSSAVEPRASESVAGSIPAPEPTVDHIVDATKLAGNRVTLACRLRGLADAARLRGPGCTPFLTCDDVDVIADMLAAPQPAGDRAALIKQLQEIAGFSHIYESDRRAVREAADMLAADANDAFAAGMACRPASAQQVAVPQGWKLVPVHPNKAMLDASFSVDVDPIDICSDAQTYAIVGNDIWHAMLAAAPQPPQAERAPTNSHAPSKPTTR